MQDRKGRLEPVEKKSSGPAHVICLLSARTLILKSISSAISLIKTLKEVCLLMKEFRRF